MYHTPYPGIHGKTNRTLCLFKKKEEEKEEGKEEEEKRKRRKETEDAKLRDLGGVTRRGEYDQSIHTILKELIRYIKANVLDVL